MTPPNRSGEPLWVCCSMLKAAMAECGETRPPQALHTQSMTAHSTASTGTGFPAFPSRAGGVCPGEPGTEMVTFSTGPAEQVCPLPGPVAVETGVWCLVGRCRSLNELLGGYAVSSRRG